MDSGTEPTLPTQRIGDRVREHRRELMAAEFERIVLELAAAKGFSNISVDEIAEAAGVSVRTFYRYFTAKEDVLSLFPRRLNEFVKGALQNETPGQPAFEVLASVNLKVAAAIDQDELRRWLAAVTSDPTPYGPIHQSVTGFYSEVAVILQEKLRVVPITPMRLSITVTAIQAAVTVAARTWYEEGGDFVALVGEGLDLLRKGLASKS